MDVIKLDELEKLLKGIQKPGRYIGNEIGIKSKPLKQLKEDMMLCALAFPDTYEMGMANLGIQVLYQIINQHPGYSAERVFAPWTDFEKALRDSSWKLFSLENRIPLNNFDLIGFNLAHELLYTNMLNMIDLAGLDIRAKDRKEAFPLICAGGTAVSNPQPVSAFLDFMIIGEGEEVILEIMARLKSYKKKDKKKKEILEGLSNIEGIYVPGLYRFYYFPSGEIKRIEPSRKVTKRVFKDFGRSRILVDPVVPNISVVHDRLPVEIMRGCPGACRFCQARNFYYPLRIRKAANIAEDTIEGLRRTGYDELSLLSLSTSDYRGLQSLLENLKDYVLKKRVSISLPSIRMESFGLDIAEMMGTGRKTGLTFAPEAGSQRMRKIIGKDIDQEAMLDCARQAFSEGWEKIKLYFMIGFPFETRQDIEAIPVLIKKFLQAAKEESKGRGFRRVNIGVSVNAMVPKPHTPFQWCGQDNPADLEEKFSIITRGVPRKAIKLNWTDPKRSRLEAALSRGDARTCDIIEEAWKRGARFDNWTDLFDYGAWESAFTETRISFYANRDFPQDGRLPWDMIDMGAGKKYLLRQFEKARQYAEQDQV